MYDRDIDKGWCSCSPQFTIDVYILMFMKITETGEKLSEILWAMVGTTGTF